MVLELALLLDTLADTVRLGRADRERPRSTHPWQRWRAREERPVGSCPYLSP